MKHPLCILLVALSLAGCKKEESALPSPTPTPAPQPDPYTYSSNTESSRKISYAISCLADLHLIPGYPAENDFVPVEFNMLPGTGNSMNEPVWIRDNQYRRIMASFSQSHCKDGRVRSGSIVMDFGYDQVQNPDADPNASHYSDHGFSGRLATYNFRVDSFLVTFSGAFIKNKTASDFDPANNDFFWELTGDFTFLRESRDTIVIKGTTTIILENTQDNSVYQPGGNIKWQNARLNYHCNLNGTINSKPFNYVVTQDTPLVRDQACSFQPSGKSPAPTHFHPFTAGVANFALANFHPRTINYGPNGICDGSGTVSFKGEVHVVDFD